MFSVLTDGSGPGTDAKFQLHVPTGCGIRQPVPHPHRSQGKHCWRHYGSAQEV